MQNKTDVFIIGTPIGNLQDISERVINSLNNTDIIYAEDTRSALKLLNHLGIKKPIKSCYKDNEKIVAEQFFADIENGKVLSLMSEAGMPTISDPGSIIIKELIRKNIKFEIVSSPTALIHAVIASGFSGADFYFYGFLPNKNSDKLKAINIIKKIRSVIIFYESPHRLKDTLSTLLETFTPPIAICRELTKMHEETIFISKLEDIDKITIKGEFVIVLDNNIKPDEEKIDNTTVYFKNIATDLLNNNLASHDILTVLKVLGAKRNEAYDIIKNLKDESAHE